MKHVRFRFTLRLWSINRLLRWTGFRLIVEWPDDNRDGPTSIGLAWWGFDRETF